MTIGAEGTIVCPFEAKNSRYFCLISFDVIYFKSFIVNNGIACKITTFSALSQYGEIQKLFCYRLSGSPAKDGVRERQCAYEVSVGRVSAPVRSPGIATGVFNYDTDTPVAHRHSCSRFEMPDRRSEMAQKYL